MTKRIISLILSVAMVLSLFTGLSFTASAASDEWVETDLADIAPSDVVVITFTNAFGTYAMSNDKGTSSAPNAVSVSVSDNKLTGEIADTIKWNVTKNDETLDWIIYPNGDTSRWLYCTNANNGVRVGTNDNKLFNISSENGYLVNVATSRYLGVYNSQDVRCYTSASGSSNIANQTLKFYKLTASSCDHDYGDGEITLAPNCTEKGIRTYTCSICGDTYTEEIPANGHKDADNDRVCDVCNAQMYVLADGISDGDKIMFVYPDEAAPKAAGPKHATGTYLTAVDAQLLNDMAAAADALIFDVEVNGSTYRFKNDDKYLSANGKTNVSFADTPDENCNWTVTFVDGVTTVKRDSFYLRFNASSPRFTTYESGQENIAIYRLDNDTDMVDVYFVDQDQNAKGYVYAFGNGNQNADFPGVEQTPLCLDENGYNVYKVTLDRNTYTNVIFSGGASDTQTANLGLGTGGSIVYYVNGHTGYVGSDYWPQPPVEVAPTCTEPGTVTYTGALTGETHVYTTDALGHEWSAWTSNNNNSHSRVCARDESHVETAFCKDENGDGLCEVCNGQMVEETSEYYVIAAKVGEKYFALPNTLSGVHPAGVEINTVSKDGAFGVGDLTFERMKVRLTEAVVGSNQWTIDNGTHRLGADGANLVWQAVSEATTDAQRWTRNDNSDEVASLVNVGANTRGLLYQDNSATVGENEQKLQRFGAYATSNLNTDTYFDVELLPLVESSEDIVIYFVDETGEETEAYYGTESPEDLTPPEVDKVSSIVDKGTDKNGNPYYKLVAPVITYKDNFIVTNGTDRSAEGYKAVHLDIVEDALQNAEGNYYVVYRIIEGEDGISVATANDVWPAPGVETAPTCEVPGKVIYTGIETGEEIEEVLPALGHDWGEWVVTAPTPGVAGERTRECARCHETETERLLYDGFYLLKGNTAWAIESINAADLFEDSTDGQKVLHTTLATGDQIKVVHVESNAITGWYPDGEGTQYTVTDDYSGNVSIFFRDTYWNDWASFGGYFWINLDSHAMQVAFSTNLDLQSSTNLIYYVSKATIDAFTFDSFKLIVKRWEDENAEPIIDEIAPQAYGSSYYRFIYRNLPPDKLNDRMEAYVEGVKDGVTWKSNSSSTNAITYCFRQAGNTGNQTRIRRLCADLIQYADAAQRYTGHNLANLPMSDSRWTADIESCATQTTPELSSAAWTKTDIDGQTANFYQTVVDLSSRVQVNFYVQLNEGLNPSDLKAICSYKDANGNDKQVVITGAEWQTVSSTQRQYMIRFSALLPSELRSAITVIVEDGEQNQISNTYVRSVEAYAARALPSANAKLADLLVAVMNYGISAEKYVLNQN